VRDSQGYRSNPRTRGRNRVSILQAQSPIIQLFFDRINPSFHLFASLLA
jgi:hypothetical protein